LGATRTFTNDTVGRVTGENTAVYAYDNADELTTNGATTQGYDAGGELTTAVTGSTSTAYVFDARGNRTTATTGTTVATYGYDQANRLTGYTSGTTTATYAYNGDGLRASKTVGGVTTTFVYDTAEGMPVILTDGASYYLYGPGGTPYAQITTAGVTTYLHADQLGSVRMITTATGTSAGTATYTAYGTRTTTGTTSAFGFAGQYTDTETGLQWDRARYYDPTTAQFLTVDPLATVTGARYAYAGGNPITGSDPTGLWCLLGGNGDGSCRGGGEYTWAVMHLDPAYLAVEGYGNEWQDASNGCSGWTVFKDGATAVAGVAATGLTAVGGAELVDGLTGAADTVPGATRALTAAEQRSVTSLQAQVDSHMAKLEAYRADPYANDNLGILENAPTPEIAQSIIDGRINHLQNEIQAFQDQIDALQGAG
jgi:RHS repeat-associated protein